MEENIIIIAQIRQIVFPRISLSYLTQRYVVNDGEWDDLYENIVPHQTPIRFLSNTNAPS